LERWARKIQEGDPEYAIVRSLDESRVKASAWYTGRVKSMMSSSHAAWMQKLGDGDLSSPVFPVDQYLKLRDSDRRKPTPDGEIPQRLPRGCLPWEEARRGAVRSSARARGLQAELGTADTPRASIRCFKHRLILRGPPVRIGLHKLNGPDTEWIEHAVQEDVARGQLTKGFYLWGSPAFPTKTTAAHKPIQRGRRIVVSVVDYRALNRSHGEPLRQCR
jgi:hypothetical protein